MEADDEEAFLAQYKVVKELGLDEDGQRWQEAECLTSKCEVQVVRVSALGHEDAGVSFQIMRGISILQGCDHPNVMKLLNVYISFPNILLVFEGGWDCTLKVYLKKYGPLARGEELRSATKQCFVGIDYLHNKLVMHRHLMPESISVRQQCPPHPRRVALTDFAKARTYDIPLKPYTQELATVWYCAPEILMGQRVYGPRIDVWSMGCILAEMATSRPLFPSDCQIDALYQIFRMLGTPTEADWRGVAQLPHYKLRTFPKWRSQIDRLRPLLGEDALALLKACLRYDCTERLSAGAALQHRFTSPPTEWEAVRVVQTRQADAPTD
eukprot:TRINITY_DN38471_c0_g1_i1.p1 TRINITY_DN38471_c0_g1~~TRINITY_DN38471_c0_g1_i1.p1  ORF type:complete len:325 (-),score=31.50 TRINITY_DN38471_c0_g1_i1:188-1162(-)